MNINITKKPNYIEKKCFLNKKLCIYQFNKKLIFRFNIKNIQKTK